MCIHIVIPTQRSSLNSEHAKRAYIAIELLLIVSRSEKFSSFLFPKASHLTLRTPAACCVPLDMRDIFEITITLKDWRLGHFVPTVC